MKKKRSILNRIYKRFTLISGIVIRFFVCFIPRNRHIIVYGGALDLFIDNTKHFFIYNNENPLLKDYQHIWLTNKRETYDTVKRLGFNVIKSNSVKGWMTMLKAKYIIFDNEIREFGYFNLSQGAIRIELWHGLPLKFWGSIKTDNQPAYVPKSLLYEKFIKANTHGDYTICTHHNQKQFFSASFKIPEDRVMVSRYPRIEVLLMDEIKRQLFVKRFESDDFNSFYNSLNKSSFYKVVYMPTFRDNNPYYLNNAIPDWKRLNEVCKQNGIMLYLKVHRVTPLPNINSFSNIQVLNNEMDIYPMLPQMDMLITDYSSIMYDFSLLEKPIVLYTYDIDEYTNDSRRVTNNYFELRKKVTDIGEFNDLLKILESPKDTIKRFPVEDYFENPHSLQGVDNILVTLNKSN